MTTSKKPNSNKLKKSRRGVSYYWRMISYYFNKIFPDLTLIVVGLLVIAFVNTPVNVQSEEPVVNARVEFQIKASDITSGVNLFEPGEYREKDNEYATLAIVNERDSEGNKKTETKLYRNVKILDLLDVNGHSIVGSATTPDSMLLSVPEGDFDTLIEWLPEKKAIYLLPQGKKIVPTIEPEQTSEPLNAAPLDHVTFDLPVDNLKTNLNGLKRDDSIVVVIVVIKKDSEGNVIMQAAHRYDDIKLLDILDGNGFPLLEQPYKEVKTVRISLAPGRNDEIAVSFASHLTGATALFLWTGVRP